MAEKFTPLIIDIPIQGGSGAADYLDRLAEIKKAQIDLREENKQLNKQLRELSKQAVADAEKQLAAQKELAANTKLSGAERLAAEKKLAAEAKKSNDRRLAAEKNIIEQLTLNGKVLRELGKEQRSFNKSLDALEGAEDSVVALTDQYNKLTDQLIRASKAYLSSAEGKRVIQQAKDLRDEINKQRTSWGDTRTVIGDYQRALTGIDFTQITKVGVAVAGLEALRRGFVAAAQTVADYEVAIDGLAAITGVSGEALEDLSERVLEVSSATNTAATDVTEAFSLVGSAAPQLLENSAALQKVTKDSLILAKAARLDVPKAVNVLTKSLNQFGASSAEASIFVDVLATSQQRGTARIEALGESLKNAGSAAKAFGLDFQTTNAALQGLAKGGLEGAEAGTKLRAILVSLAGTGRTELNPALNDFNDILDTLADEIKEPTDAIEIFGKENFNAAIALVEQRKTVADLREEFKSLSPAVDQAATNTDNLVGKYNALKVAIDNFILSLDSGDGIISRFFKNLTDGTTQIIKDITALNNRGLFQTLQDFANGTRKANVLLEEFRADLGADIGSDETKLFDLILYKSEDVEQAFVKFGAATDVAKQKTQELFESLGAPVVAKLRSAGVQIIDIAEQTGLSVQQVQKIVLQLGDEITDSTKAGAEGVKEVEKAAKTAAKEAEKAATGMNAFNEEIRKLQEQLRSEADPALYRSIEKEIDAVQEKIEKFLGDVERIRRGESAAQTSIAPIATLDLIPEQVDSTTDEGLGDPTDDDFIQLDKLKVLEELRSKIILDERKSLQERLQELDRTQNRIYLTALQRTGMAVEELFTAQENRFKEFTKALAITALDALQRSIIARITASELATKGFAGLASAALLNGIVAGLFSAARAALRRLKRGGEIDWGNSHEAGGTVVEAERGEVFLNKKIMASKQQIAVSGTPKQIASAINSMNNTGDSFAPGATFLPAAPAALPAAYMQPMRLQPPVYIRQQGGKVVKFNAPAAPEIDYNKLATAVAGALQNADITASIDYRQHSSNLKKIKEQLARKRN